MFDLCNLAGMTPTATVVAAVTTMSQQPACPTATNKQTRTGTKYPVQGMSPHSDIYIYIYIIYILCREDLCPFHKVLEYQYTTPLFKHFVGALMPSQSMKISLPQLLNL